MVIYDSKFGNTAQIANRIAETLADRLGERGTVRLASVGDVHVSEFAGLDLLVMGGPTQRQKTSPVVRAFLESIPGKPLRDVEAAAFDTRYDHPMAGSAARRIASKLRGLGARRLLKPESVIVADREGPLIDGELERAADWAEGVFQAFEERRASR